MHKKIIISSLAFAAAAMLMSGCSNQARKSHTHHVRTETTAKPARRSYRRPAAKDTAMRSQPNYKLPSEKKPYPKLVKSDSIVVSIPKQRAYIFTNRHRLIYEMFVSTGSHNRTPRGRYHINSSRGRWFYSPEEREGAQYATGWHDGGVYLFHATPANQKHQVFAGVAHDLGRKPSSHGCVHLSIPDAEWLYKNATVGMKVIIK